MGDDPQLGRVLLLRVGYLQSRVDLFNSNVIKGNWASHSLTLAYVFPMIDRPGKIESVLGTGSRGTGQRDGLLWSAPPELLLSLSSLSKATARLAPQRRETPLQKVWKVYTQRIFSTQIMTLSV